MDIYVLSLESKPLKYVSDIKIQRYSVAWSLKKNVNKKNSTRNKPWNC